MARIQTEIYTENLSRHIVIYGWQHHYKMLLEELRGEGLNEQNTILIVNHDPTRKLDVALGPDIYLLNTVGDHEANLLAANIPKAKSLLIASSREVVKNSKAIDANAILLCLLAKKLQPNIQVIVDLPFGNNIEHLFNAGVDEVIRGEQFCSMITASAILNEGITSFYREILSTRYGNEFYKAKFSSKYWGMTFLHAMEKLKEEQGAILLAIMRGSQIITNPHFLIIEKDDIGVVLSEGKIEEL